MNESSEGNPGYFYCMCFSSILSSVSSVVLVGRWVVPRRETLYVISYYRVVAAPDAL